VQDERAGRDVLETEMARGVALGRLQQRVLRAEQLNLRADDRPAPRVQNHALDTPARRALPRQRRGRARREQQQQRQHDRGAEHAESEAGTELHA
jgi:hypothetical protein